MIALLVTALVGGAVAVTVTAVVVHVLDVRARSASLPVAITRDATP